MADLGLRNLRKETLLPDWENGRFLVPSSLQSFLMPWEQPEPQRTGAEQHSRGS